MFGLGSFVNDAISLVDDAAEAVKDTVDSGFETIGIDSRSTTKVVKTVGMVAAVYVAEDAVVDAVIDAFSDDEDII